MSLKGLISTILSIALILFLCKACDSEKDVLNIQEILFQNTIMMQIVYLIVSSLRVMKELLPKIR